MQPKFKGLLPEDKRTYQSIYVVQNYKIIIQSYTTLNLLENGLRVVYDYTIIL